MAMGDISPRKTDVEDKRAKMHKESKFLIDYTRNAITRLTYLKRYGFELSTPSGPIYKRNLGQQKLMYLVKNSVQIY